MVDQFSPRTSSPGANALGNAFAIYDLRITILPPLKTTRVKNERKTVEEKGVKKREKWEVFEGGKWEKCPRGYAPSIARYLKNEFLEVPDLRFGF